MTDETTQLPWQKASGSAVDQAANKPTMIGITPKNDEADWPMDAERSFGLAPYEEPVEPVKEEPTPAEAAMAETLLILDRSDSLVFKPVENVTFYSPSEKATRMINANEAKAVTEGVWAGIRVSFMDCPVGRSFLVSKTIEEKNLRVVVSRKAKKAERRYSVVAHPDCFEIYRHE